MASPPNCQVPNASPFTLKSNIDDFLHKTYAKRIIYILFIFSSIIASFLYSAAQGGTPFEIFLPASFWNDEVFYFKQIEAMVHHGIPQGYFGYNEVPPQLLTFGAWSPAIYLPYVFLGKLFGWNFHSPILYNLLLITVSYAIFILLVKPTVKQTLFLFIFMQFFTIYTRHIISGMTEALSYSIIMLTALLCTFFNSNIQEKQWLKLILTFLLTIFSIGLFFGISNNLSAPYLTPIINLSFLDILKNDGIIFSLAHILSTLYNNFN